jgi:hypothetical protein
MKRRFTGFLLASTILLCILTTSSPAAEKTDTLIVIARLIEIPGKFASNDLYNYVYIMKYLILKVERGACTSKELLVGQYNPLIPRNKIRDKMRAVARGNVDKFSVGAKHRLVLIAPISAVWNDAVEDEYFDSENIKYYALQSDVVK